MRIPGSIPVTIRLSFWLVAALLGFLGTGDPVGMVMWVMIILLSVLIHEFGHALTAKAFGQRSRIELVAFGGVTIREQVKKLSAWKEFFIVLNGPVFGAALALVSYVLMQQAFSEQLVDLFRTLFLVNVFWTLINLIPIVPLDGGQLLTILLESSLGPKGVRASYLIGGVLGLGISLGAFLFHRYFLGVILFMFSIESLRLFWASRFLQPEDRDLTLQKVFQEAQFLYLQGDLDTAEKKLSALCERTKHGILYNESISILAQIRKSRGQLIEAYELLKPVGKQLSAAGKLLLHELAVDLSDYSLASQYASECFQLHPGSKVAFLNARTYAALGKKAVALGWLESAIREGLAADPEAVNEHQEFISLKKEREYQELMKKLQADS